MKTYRSLTQEEIQQLKERSCTAVDWAEIEVVENFKTDYICHTRFLEGSDWEFLKTSLCWRVACVNIPDCIMRLCIM